MQRAAARIALLAAGLAATAALAMLAAPAAAQELPESEGWVEVRSPHFIVLSDAGEKQARRIAGQFENIRGVYQRALPNARVDAPMPVLIFAARNARTLDRLLPNYQDQSARTRPAGVFVSSNEKHYVALRTDASGDNPYQIVYHEYFHVVTRLSLGEIPLWLNEGMAEFWGHARFVGRSAVLGDVAAHHIRRLRDEGLIPLEEFFAVGHASPWYRGERKGLFYAQAWALVHLLMVGERGGPNRARINQLLGALERGVPAADAHRQVFGDYGLWRRELEAYIRRDAHLALTMDAPPRPDEKTFAARPLAPAETAARQADLMVLLDRPAEARALADRALALDERNALAWEVRGNLLLREAESDEAMEAFARAAELDSDSFLAHFYHAMLLTNAASSADDQAAAEAGLRRSIALHPGFPPAWSTLGLLLVRQPGREAEALEAAQRAATLEPGSVNLQVNLAHVLLRLERLEEARRAALRAAARAETDAERMAVEQLQFALSQYEDFRSRRALEIAGSRPQLSRRPPPGPTPALPPPPAEPPAADRARATPLRERQGLESATATGKISRVTCGDDLEMELVLEFDRHTLVLRAEDFSEIEYRTVGWNPPANFLPCQHLRERTAEVKYLVVSRRPFRGEIVSITIRE